MMAHSSGFFMLFHLSTEPGIPLLRWNRIPGLQKDSFGSRGIHIIISHLLWEWIDRRGKVAEILLSEVICESFEFICDYDSQTIDSDSLI